MSKARQAAEAYIQYINSSDGESLLGLFSDDAELVNPIGSFQGIEKLRSFYEGIVLKADTKLTAGEWVTEGNTSMVEVTGVSPAAPEKPVHACDVFTVDETGKIARLAIYYRNLAG